jgi:ribonuclease D
MDCEGLELGDAQGRLTIIQIIPITHPSVSYLVDIQELEQQQVPLKPLKLLLSDPSVTKVFYDCRNDAAALWYEQECQLKVRNTAHRQSVADRLYLICSTFCGVTYSTGSQYSLYTVTVTAAAQAGCCAA